MLLAVLNQKNPQGRGSRIYINTSTTNGIDLAEYYREKIGTYPLPDNAVRFIILEGVDIIAPNTSTAAIITGTNWPVDNIPVVENRGRILGRGGRGGRGAEWITESPWGYNNASNPPADGYITPATPGENGGPAVKTDGSVLIDNYGLIAGGGGGGGGAGASLYINDANINGGYLAVHRSIGGGGSGGGAPLGKRSPNANTIESYYDNPAFEPHFQFERYPSDDTYTYLKKGRKGLSGAHDDKFGTGSYVRKWVGLANLSPPVPYEPADNYSFITAFIPQYLANGVDYQLASHSTNQTDLYPGGRVYTLTTEREGLPPTSITYYETRSSILKQSQSGEVLIGGAGGYGGIGLSTQNDLLPEIFDEHFTINLSLNSGGRGGDVGEDGLVGKRFANSTITQKNSGLLWPGTYHLRSGRDAAVGGLAGFIKEGNVTIVNHAGGITKGR